MQNGLHRTTTIQKEPCQTCLILDISNSVDLSKLHALESDYFKQSDHFIQLLKYKGCALAMWDATEQGQN